MSECFGQYSYWAAEYAAKSNTSWYLNLQPILEVTVGPLPFDSLPAAATNWVEFFAAINTKHRVTSVLDVGCGTSESPREWREVAGAQAVFGCDYVDAAVQQQRARLSDACYHFFVWDVFGFPLQPRYALPPLDCVFAKAFLDVALIGHRRIEAVAAVDGLLRLLRPGGCLLSVTLQSLSTHLMLLWEGICSHVLSLRGQVSDRECLYLCSIRVSPLEPPAQNSSVAAAEAVAVTHDARCYCFEVHLAARSGTGDASDATRVGGATASASVAAGFCSVALQIDGSLVSPADCASLGLDSSFLECLQTDISYPTFTRASKIVSESALLELLSRVAPTSSQSVTEAPEMEREAPLLLVMDL